jgi:quercetin dioxygenase-like cupin family protein
MSETTTFNNLDGAMERYRSEGYRLEMIKPADAPREALMSKDGETVRLRLENHAAAEAPPLLRREENWVKGRAGMEYRDLVTDRMDGRMAVSHIRLTEEGEVPDYVHYHKVEFQMIRCIKGRIKVVYEDQGEPFWLEIGDWVIQPPEIRHRVLFAEAGSEVIEISMPAEHETWVDHEMTLPTDKCRPDRDFKGQRFVRFIAPKS